ncbi:MAG: hypothetical protein NTX24_00605 [Candidatus Pacearchaeota archaeon]|nr:hypothetical protein [Candidatus Pacearchaeota archaeon]
MKQLFILLAVALFVFFIHGAMAFNCQGLNENDSYICNYIQNSNLTQIEKDLIISDIYNPNKTTANFDFVYYWNTALNITDSPDNITTDQGTIKHAWLKIMTLMPSILENNTIYGSTQGKLMSVYGYNVELPTEKESGDCKTTYSLVSNTNNLDIFLNNDIIGHDKLTGFTLPEPEDLNFQSILNIQVRYKIKHYELNNGSCDYSYSEYQTDTLQLTDTFFAKAYREVPESSFKITDKILDTTKGFIQADNYAGLILSFDNSSFEKRKYVYHLNYSLPYYVLTIRAEPFNESIINNLFIEEQNNKFLFSVKDADNCQIKLFNHFDSITKPCDTGYSGINLSITTDKLNYYENETIKVNITPSNISVNLTYDNITKQVQGYAEFNSTLYQNKITAVYGDEEAERYVNVIEKSKTTFLFNFGILCLFGLFFFKFLKSSYQNFNLK